MRKCRCRFLLPLAYNDGKPIAPSLFMKFKGEITRQFGAYRIVTECSEGSWQGQVEGVMEIEVAVTPKRIPQLRALVIEIGKELGQKCMYFDAPQVPTVEIIDTETGELEEDDEDCDEVGNDN